ncbi:MAG: tyrosine protein kinase [Candidatus Binatia bacterium]|nr:MAG: tyrosine protein kinase [Candidatus Binatia bacterium]
MSKIYEALKKAEEERERGRVQTPSPVVPPALTDPAAAIQEDYQRLRASVLSMTVPAGLHTLLLVSAQHREGTTTVALGLALALARERDSRVLLMEANLRSPSLRHLLPVPTSYGLSDYALGRAAPEAIVTRVDEWNLSVIPAGTQPATTVAVEAIETLLARLQPQFDFVVIDGPPVNVYADAAVIGSKVDGVILVFEADRTPVTDAEAAKRQLDRVGARILGVVLNRQRSYIPAFLENLL